MNKIVQLPPQQLPFNKKGKEWRKKHLDWADSKTFANYSPVRKSVLNKKINYDLLNGKLHMEDVAKIINPAETKASYIPESIQHFPIINSKLQVLRGEERKRPFDFRVIVTNPNAITEIETAKREQLLQNWQQLIQNTVLSEEDYQKKLEELNEYYLYEWQDFREVRANALLNHYDKELDLPTVFNDGFMDALTVGEELYLIDLIDGEPTIERLNPLKTRIYRSGFSKKVEDADIVIIEDYWSPSRIIDTYYESLTEKDIKYLENINSDLTNDYIDDMDNIDESFGFVDRHMIDDTFGEGDFYWNPFGEGELSSLSPYDSQGNVRVIKMFWKSRRRIKKVKSYNIETGEVEYNFYPENYIIDETLGEEEEIFFINEAWEGVKIGKEIYVNMRPRPIQFNRLNNPSRCHFGIIGTIYNLNDDKPFSLVDIMKPYSYYYDVIHDRLNKTIANNWGKMIQADLAKIPKGWDMDKWMYFAKNYNIAIIDSFREGNIGASTGKLAGGLNNATSGVYDAELSQSIQMYINLLEYIKTEMSEVAGISKQREGQIDNRETVGGVERATLQSSHITEYLFSIHENLKKRVYECVLEVAKMGMKGRNKKFEYILPDHSMQIINIEGDEFSECDYGLCVANNKAAAELNSKLETLAQAALQNQMLNFSTMIKLFNTTSLAEKQRMVEKNEQMMQQQAQQAQQQQQQQFEQQLQQQAQMEEAKMQLQDMLNARDNETRIQVAVLQKESYQEFSDNLDREENEKFHTEDLAEKKREFDAKLNLEKEKLQFQKDKAKTDAKLKEKQINKTKTTNTTKK